MVVYLTRKHKQFLFVAILSISVVSFTLYMYIDAYKRDKKSKNDSTTTPDKFTDGKESIINDEDLPTTEQSNLCDSLQNASEEFNHNISMIKKAINGTSQECKPITSEEKIQDLFYIGALRLIGSQTDAYLMSKKTHDDTLDIIDKMDDNELENFVITLAEIYAKNNGVLEKAINYFSGQNKQKDASKLEQLKDMIRGDNEPSVALLDETNPLIIEYMGTNMENLSEDERNLEVGGCYILPNDVKDMSKCDMHIYLRNLTENAGKQLNKFCRHCDVSDIDNIIPRTAVEQDEVLKNGICDKISKSVIPEFLSFLIL